MKIKIEIEGDLYEDAELIKTFQDAQKNAALIEDTWELLFRPVYKGYEYNDKKLQELIDSCGVTLNSDGEEENLGISVIERLSELYLELKDEQND